MSLFKDREPISRQDFLKKWFKDSFWFTHWGEIPVKYEFVQEDDEVLAGAVCRWRAEDTDADPDDPFATVEGGRWAKAAFFFNIEEHQQVFGIEHNTLVGSPSQILAGLARRINEKTEGNPYSIEVAELNVKGSFREAIQSYPGKVTSLQFRFVVPNPPDVEKATREALKKLGKKTGADEAIETLKSEKGLKTESDYVTDAVDYIEDGGGDVIAKDGNTSIYNSTARVRTESVHDELAPTGSMINGLADFVKSLLRK